MPATYLQQTITKMKKELKKIEQSLELAGFTETKIPVLKVYLSIVLLGKKIPEVAKYFRIPEKKVQHALTVCGVKFKKCSVLRTKLRIATKQYRFNNEIELAA